MNQFFFSFVFFLLFSFHVSYVVSQAATISPSVTSSGPPPPSDVCAAAAGDCGMCSEQSNCVFCWKQSVCVDGNMFGPDISTCGRYRWRQCAIDGVWLLVSIAGAIVIVVLICILLLVLCFCCTKCRRRRPVPSIAYSEQVVRAQQEERLLAKGGSRTPVTDTHRAAMQEKYGIKKSGIEESSV